MSLSRRLILLSVCILLGSNLRAADAVNPISVSDQIPAQTTAPNAAPITVNLQHYIEYNTLGTDFVQFDTVFGKFNVGLRRDRAPNHVANFLQYVEAGAYNNSFFHRTAKFSANSDPAITQAGGFRLPYSSVIPSKTPIGVEGDLANTYGTIAAARQSDPNSATSQFYFNTVDNSSVLLPGNSGTTQSYSVFGSVLGTGMSIVKEISLVPTYNAVDGSANTGAFAELPLRNRSGNTLTEQNLVIIRSIKQLPLFAATNELSVVLLSAQSSDPAVAEASISGSSLVITPKAKSGTTTITVTASDVNGNTAKLTTTHTNDGTLAIVTQPRSQTVTAGDVVAFHVTATGASLSYQWNRDGQPVFEANDSILLVRNTPTSSAGNYTVTVSNGVTSITSTPATLTVTSGTQRGRLSNFSVRGLTGQEQFVMIAGITIEGPAETNFLIRGIGPGLGKFNVIGFVTDPRIELHSGDTMLDSNDDWQGSDGSVYGAFPLTGGSKDAVLLRPLTNGPYTTVLRGAGHTTGDSLIEIYETNPTASNQLINISGRSYVGSSWVATTGFVIGPGTGSTVLLRAVSSNLGQFGINVEDTVENPRLDLFRTSGNQPELIAQNDDWGGRPTLISAMASAGAFAIPQTTSKDAVLLVTLPPGSYTAQASSVGGRPGTALVEVYLVR
ncbi:MAG TPA: peptidylprolyl isomerase [Opitutaceae bacterium]|nr:peptidylprolyl isomerase [Opitutaceae bacterium]